MKTLFAITLLVELLFGIALVIVPSVFIGALGGRGGTFETTLIRLLGSALLGFSVLLWFGRTTDAPAVHGAVLASMFTYWTVSSLLLLLDHVIDEPEVEQWGITGLHVLLAVSFGYYLFVA